MDYDIGPGSLCRDGGDRGRWESPVTEDSRLREISFGEAEERPNAWLAERQVPAPDHDRLDHRGPIVGAETRREVASRVGACVTECCGSCRYLALGQAEVTVVSACSDSCMKSARSRLAGCSIQRS
ncbi:histidine phosphatase family protein [Nocardia sp. N2S4-5]|uniref:histidine phosphatase family protein n=1 Tax=Nocardia sp. N2S4-5 TaxID=3351565 RepID=UPI0037D93B51